MDASTTAFKKLSTLDQASIKGKRVVMRVDLNLPLNENQRITDTTRIMRFQPTLNELKQRGAKHITLVSHFGRPKGKRDPLFSFSILLPQIEKILGEKIMLLQHDSPSKQGTLSLLENLRFDPGETANDKAFAKKIARLGEIYVNDAFSVSHRAHASIDAITQLLPAFAGRALEQEYSYLNQALENPKRPLCLIIAGSKISTKLHVLERLCEKADKIIIAGGIANTLLFAKGIQVGRSLCETEMLNIAQHILQKSKAENCPLILPEDVITAPSLDSTTTNIKKLNAITEQDMILDIGPETIVRISKLLETCATLLVNGPLGVFEKPAFANGTRQIFNHIARLTKEKRLLSIAGGGDTLAALNAFGLKDRLSYQSTAGGAFLEYLEGRQLPGIEALRR